MGLRRAGDIALGRAGNVPGARIETQAALKVSPTESRRERSGRGLKRCMKT